MGTSDINDDLEYNDGLGDMLKEKEYHEFSWIKTLSVLVGILAIVLILFVASFKFGTDMFSKSQTETAVEYEDIILKKAIGSAYVGIADVDSEKNPRTKPNMHFEPIFENFYEVVDKFKTESILDMSGRVAWDNKDEINFVKKWHDKGKSQIQIAKGYMQFCEGGDLCDGTLSVFSERSEMGIKNYIDRCYENKTLRPHRISWEREKDLAFSAIWIAELERPIQHMGFVQRTQKVLNDFYFDGKERIGVRSLECFLKRNKNLVEKVPQLEFVD